MSEQQRNRVDGAIACAAVVLAQMLLFAALTRVPVTPAGRDDPLVVEYVRRTAPRKQVPTPPTPRSSQRRSAVSAVGMDRLLSRSAEANANKPDERTSTAMSETARWDLSLPPDVVHQVSPEPGFETRSPVEVQTTRFEQAWVPQGNALRQASFHSKVIGTALSAFGGPPRRCNEVERRLRRINCLPLHGQDADDEALRRDPDP